MIASTEVVIRFQQSSLFDNFSSHLDLDLLEILADNLILVITYASHTSHIFQVLDLLLFIVLKVYKKSIPKNDQNSPKIDHLYRVFHAYELNTCSTTIRSSFMGAKIRILSKRWAQLFKIKFQQNGKFKKI